MDATTIADRPRRARSFLQAEWRRLAMANYAVDPACLEPYLPAGTRLDFWQGRCYVSLIGFMFLNTVVQGLAIPWHVNFEEVNLRFYVLREVDGELRRGVVFIREVVPLPAIAWTARLIYGEPYDCLPMGHEWREAAGELHTSYRWKKAGQWQRLSVRTATEPVEMAAGSEEEFITEHYWGYTRLDARRTREYEVRHPRWRVYPVRNHEIQVDFALMYGPGFAVLNGQEPDSICLAEGSAVSVQPYAPVAALIAPRSAV